MIFRELIKKKIAEKGLTITDAAQLCGISPSHLGQVMNGNTGVKDSVSDKIISGLGLDEYEARKSYKEDCLFRFEGTKRKKAALILNELQDQITIAAPERIKPHFHCALCGVEIPATDDCTFNHPDCDNYFKLLIIPSPKNSILNSNSIVDGYVCPECAHDLFKKILDSNIEVV